MVKRFLSAALMLMVVFPLLAQPPTGRGVITLSDTADVSVIELLYPMLYATDSVTGGVIPPSEDNVGLAESILLTSDTTQQIHLREDFYWGDGQPVTAYDVLFSMLAFQNDESPVRREIQAITVEDEYTLTVVFKEPDCAAPAQINLMVRPAHVFTLDFVGYVDALKAENAAPLTFREWAQADVLRYPIAHDDVLLQRATAGAFRLVSERSNGSSRLVSDETALIIRDFYTISLRVTKELAFYISDVEAFLAGEVSYIGNPPLNRRADLLAQPDLQISVEPSERWAVLLFNFADPDKPRDAFDAEGNPREQGINPLVSDLAVRQAIRLGIDVDAIISEVYQGYAEPLASLWPPTSWAHDASRPVKPHDFRAAQDILQAAGWWDANGDGIRECRECTTALIDTPLMLDMVLDDSLSHTASLIARQLSRIGIGVSFTGDAPSAQRFDVYLAARVTAPTADPDLSHWFRREFDQRNIGSAAPNYGSYHDETVEQLFTQARTVDSCEMSVRRDVYNQIQDEFDAQVTVIPLFVEQDMSIAQPSVLGFDPLPGRPLWNIRDWVVMP